MKVERKLTESICDDTGRPLSEGDVVIYRQESGNDQIGMYIGYGHGLLSMERMSDGHKYQVRVSSVVYCRCGAKVVGIGDGEEVKSNS